MDSKFTVALAVLLVALVPVAGATVMTSGAPLSGAIAPLQQQQNPQNTCADGTELLVKFEWVGEEFVPEEEPAGVSISNVSTDEEGEPMSFDWSSTEAVETIQVKGGLNTASYSGGTTGFIQFGTSPSISNVIFCVLPDGAATPTAPSTQAPPPADTSTPTAPSTQAPPPTDTSTPTAPSTSTPDPDTVYWQVDFGEGENPPVPPSYWPDDLMAALGNSDEGVVDNPSVRRQGNDGQLKNVTIIDTSFNFDNEDDPTSVTVEFKIDEGAPARDLHIASFVLPGPYEHSEIDQQELHEVSSGTFEGGETGQLNVSIP